MAMAESPGSDPFMSEVGFVECFLGEMSENNSEKNPELLRRFIDPEYLREHLKPAENRPVQTIEIARVESVSATEDPTTILCDVISRHGTRKILVFRIVTRNRIKYLNPVSVQDPFVNVLRPWIFRKELTTPNKVQK
jgi:hypothetical protein